MRKLLTIWLVVIPLLVLSSLASAGSKSHAGAGPASPSGSLLQKLSSSDDPVGDQVQPTFGHFLAKVRQERNYTEGLPPRILAAALAPAGRAVPDADLYACRLHFQRSLIFPHHHFW